MSADPQKPAPGDPTTWPVVECEAADVFLGSSDHDCTPVLTDEQKTWPVVECEAADISAEGEQAPPKRLPPTPSR